MIPVPDYPMWLWLLPSQEPPGTYDTISSRNLLLQKYIKRRFMPYGTQGGKRIIKHYFSTRKAYPGDNTWDTGFDQSSTAGPVKNWFWHFGLRDGRETSSAIPAVVFPTELQITYYCRFHGSNIASMVNDT